MEERPILQNGGSKRKVIFCGILYKARGRAETLNMWEAILVFMCEAEAEGPFRENVTLELIMRFCSCGSYLEEEDGGIQNEFLQGRDPLEQFQEGSCLIVEFAEEAVTDH